MPILVATFTSHTAPINSAPDAVQDKPLGQGKNYFNLWQEKQGISFGDFLDVINPLQDIPIVSTIYRAVTGDAIGFASRLLGGGLFGGPAGIMVAGMQAALEGTTGKEVGGTVLAFLQDISGFGDESAQVAAADAKAAGLPNHRPA